MNTPKTLSELRELAHKADTYQKRALVLESALVFAMFTVQDRTDKAEKRFVWWHENGRPWNAETFPAGLKVRFPGPMTDQLIAVKLFLSRPVIVQQVWKTADHELLVNSIRGISHAKARFSLALAGIGKGACLDIHVMREYQELLTDYLTPTERKRLNAPGTIARYRTAELLLAMFWGTPNDPAAGQWAWWFGHRSAVGLGKEEHEPYVNIIREIAC